MNRSFFSWRGRCRVVACAIAVVASMMIGPSVAAQEGTQQPPASGEPQGPALGAAPPSLEPLTPAQDTTAGPSASTDVPVGDAATVVGEDGSATVDAASSEVPSGDGDPLFDRSERPHQREPLAAEVSQPDVSNVAPDPWTQIEDVSARHAAGTTYESTDGARTSVVAAGDLFWKNASGDWETLDPTLTAGLPGTTTPVWRNRSGPFRVEFAQSTSTSGPLAKVTLAGGRSFAYRLVGALPADGVRQPLLGTDPETATTVAYSDVLAGVDLRLDMTRSGFKESWVLAGPDAPRDLTFDLTLDGLTARLDDTGAIELVATGGADVGTVVGRIPRGFMQEPEVVPGVTTNRSDGVEYRLLGNRLEVHLDDAWLDDPTRIWPVTVDPSFDQSVVVGADSDDMTVYSGSTSDADSTDLHAGPLNYPVTFQSRAFMKFGMALLGHAHVVNATLQMWQHGGGSCGVSRPISAYRILQSWTGGPGWPWNGPTADSTAAATTWAQGQGGGCDSWVELDVSSLVQQWLRADITGVVGYGLAVEPPPPYDTDWNDSFRVFYSANTLLPPRILLNWNSVAAEYTQAGTFVMPLNNQTGSEVVQVRNLGMDPWPANGDYKLVARIYNSDGSWRVDGPHVAMPTTVGYNQTATVTATIPQLPPSTYKVVWDMIYEPTGTWFSGQHVQTMSQWITVPALGAVIDSASIDSTGTLGPKFTATAHDGDGLGTLTYTFTVCTGKDAKSGSCATSGSQTANYWSVPAGLMSWRTTYYWNVSISDGSAPSPTKFVVPGRVTPVPDQPAGSHAGADPTSVSAKDVNLYNGNLVARMTDATTSGVGPMPAIYRTYNSAETRAANSLMFGEGWSSTYDMTAITDTDGSALITFPDGRKTRFGKNPDGTYGAPASMYAQLDRTAGAYTLIDGNGTRYAFGANDGPLTTITDVDGHALQLSYTSGKLSTITSTTTGRTLTLTWSGAHVTAVTTQAIAGNNNQPYTWTYAYNGDQLASVCSPKSTTACVTYAYQNVSGAYLLAGITMPKGNTPVQVHYAADKTVDWRKDAANNQWSFTYETVNGLRRTTVTDPAAHTSVTRFDAAGRVTTTVNEDGAVTRRTYNDLGYLADTTDGNGHVTRYAYDVHGNVLRRIAPRTSAPNYGTTLAQTASASVGWWRLGETSGTTATDQTTGAHHGTYVNGPTLGGEGALSGDPTFAATFNGTSQYVQIPHGSWANLTGDLTIEAWIRPDGSQSDQTIVAKRDTNSTTPYALRLAGLNALEAYENDGSDLATLRGTYTFQIGRWYHVAFTRQGNDARLYVDGILIKASSNTFGNAPTGNTRDVLIGAATVNGTPGQFFKGGIQDVTLISQALDASTLAAHYGAGLNSSYRDLLPTSSIPPTAWWRLGESSGTNAVDSSGSNLTATYQGTPTYGQSGAISGDTNTSVGFNGTNTYVQLPSGFSDFTNGLTLEAWVKPTATSTWSRIFDLGNGAPSDNIVLARNSNTSQIYFGVASGTTQDQSLITPDNALTLNQWSHVVATVDATGVGRVYINGLLKVEGPIRVPRVVTRTANYIGKSNWAADALFAGQIDDAAIYSASLPADMVAAHYRAGTTTATNQATTLTTSYGYYRTPYNTTTLADGPAGYWRLGEASGNAADSSGNNHPGTVHQSVTRVSSGAIVNDTNGSMITTSGAGTQSGSIAGTGITTTNSTGFTLESWVNIPDANRKGAFVTTGGTSSTNYVAIGVGRSTTGGNGNMTRTGKRLLVAYGGVATKDTGIDIGSGWHHVALRINAGAATADVFLDGSKVATISGVTPGTSRDSNWSIGGLKIGDQSDYRTDAIGYQDAAIYTAPLSDTRVREHYLVGVWQNVDVRNDLPLTERDPRSTSTTDNTYKTTYTYDSAARLSTMTTPASAACPTGCQANLSYTAGSEPAYGSAGTMPAGLPRTLTDARNGTTTYDYDAHGDVRRVTDPVLEETSYTYDELGRTLTSTANPGGTTTMTYDELSRPATVTEPGITNPVTNVVHKLRTTYTYDANENLTQVEQADTTGGDNARVTGYDYDTNDRAVSHTDPRNKTTTLAYDNLGRVATSTDANNATTEYAYTPSGRLWKTIAKNFVDDPYANGGTGTTPRDVTVEQRSYDPSGRLARTVDANGHTIAYTYTDDNLPATTTLLGYHRPDNTTTDVVTDSHTYDPAGNLVSRVEAGGTLLTTYNYDATNRITSATLDPLGALNRTRTFTYDPSGNVITTGLSGAGGAGTLVQTFTYDAANRVLTARTDPTGLNLTDTYLRDSRGLVLQHTDPANHTTDYTYDALSRAQQVQSPQVVWEEGGNASANARPTTTYGYDTFGERTHERDARDQVSTTSYTPTGLPASRQAPSYTPPGGTPITPTTTLTYDNAGNLATITDPTNQTTTYDYDKRNRLIRSTDPTIAGVGTAVTRLFYDDLNQLLQVNGPTGTQQNATYDDLGRTRTTSILERTPNPQTLTTRYDYDYAGNRTTLTTPANETWTATYNPDGQTTSQTDPTNQTSTLAYDGRGLLTQITDPANRSTVYGYDTAGRQTSLTQRDATGTTLTVTSVGLDTVGNRTSITDPNGTTTTAAYDALGHLTSVVEPVDATPANNLTTTFGYDKAGNRTRVTDPAGHPTITTYNTLGLREHVIEPATTAHPNLADRTWTWTYDTAGRVTTYDEPGGVTRTNTYNERGWLTGEAASGGGAPSVTNSYGYDLAGNLTAFSHPSGTVALAYNDRQQIIGATGPAGTSNYTYDADGRMTQRVDAAGTTNYTWTTRGELATLTDPLTGETATYTYNSDITGRVDDLTYGTGKASRHYTYDDLDRLRTDTLKNGAGTSIDTAAYTYDNNSNLITKTLGPTGVAGAGTNTYTYDRANRLTSWTSPTNTNTTYTYDGASNRTTAGPTNYVYDERNRLVSETTSGATTTYTHTPRGTLASATDTAGTTNITFDALDRLTNWGTTTYTYDALDRLASTPTATFTYDGAEPEPTSDGTWTYARDPAGTLVALTSTTSGPLAAMTDRHGDLIATYQPTGTTITDGRAYNPTGQPTATTGTNNPPVGYQTQYTDPTSGLVHMQTRWYMPGQAAFTNRDLVDPAIRTASLNRFVYGEGNPTTHTDFTGRQVDPAALAKAGVGLQVEPGAGTIVGGAFLIVAAGCAFACGGADLDATINAYLAAQEEYWARQQAYAEGYAAVFGSYYDVHLYDNYYAETACSLYGACSWLPLPGPGGAEPDGSTSGTGSLRCVVYCYTPPPPPIHGPFYNPSEHTPGAPDPFGFTIEKPVENVVVNVGESVVVGPNHQANTQSHTNARASNSTSRNALRKALAGPGTADYCPDNDPLCVEASNRTHPEPTGSGESATEDVGAARLPQDVGVNPTAPRALPLDRPVGLSETQNEFVQSRIGGLQEQGATDFRVNQQQVDINGTRVGINRPDLQYTLDGQRFYEEFDTPMSGRGPGHAVRIGANDPSGIINLFTVL